MRVVVVWCFVMVAGFAVNTLSAPANPSLGQSLMPIPSQSNVRGNGLLHFYIQPRQYAPFKPPPTLAQLYQAFLKATRNWFADLIYDLLGITAGDLIKQINNCLVGMTSLVQEAVTELEEIIEKVPVEIKDELNEIINDALEKTLEIMAPILEQLRQVIPHLPNTRGISLKRDFVSDLIEAILGFSLEEFITNINIVLVEMNTLLLETLRALSNVAMKVSPEIASEIELVITNTLEKAQELLRPLMNSLGQLPINKTTKFHKRLQPIQKVNEHY